MRTTNRRFTTYWRTRLCGLSVVLALTGCVGLDSSVPLPYDVASQAEQLAEQGKWEQAAATQQRAVQLNIELGGLFARTARYAADAAGYWNKAGNHAAAQANWQEAIAYQQKQLDATLARQTASSSLDVVMDYFGLVDYLTKSGNSDGAMAKLQEARAYAELEWNKPLAPEEFPPRMLNQGDLEIAKRAILHDEAVAYSALDSLWSRRSHPYTVDGSAHYLVQAGDLFAHVGDLDYARRMYLAVVDTPQLQREIVSPPEELTGEERIAFKLRNLGFEEDARRVEARADEIREMVGTSAYRQLAAALEAARAAGNYAAQADVIAEMESLVAEGHAYFGRHAVADSFKRQVSRHVAYEQKRRQDEIERKKKKKEKPRQSASPAPKEKGSISRQGRKGKKDSKAAAS